MPSSGPRKREGISDVSRRLRHLASALAAAAQDVSTDEGFSAWVALHGDLPDESLTPLEVVRAASPPFLPPSLPA